VKKKLKKKVAW